MASKKTTGNKINKSMKNGKGPLKTVPLARARVGRNTKPKITNTQGTDGRIRVRHREYIGDVFGSVGFNAVGFAINPGNSGTFPWLSGLASLYETYTFHRLDVCYETQRSASTDGAIMMAVDYNAQDQPPASKLQVMSYHDAVRSPVWGECTYRCSGTDLRKIQQRYVRQGLAPVSSDLKTYDVGNLFVCTQGEDGVGLIGEVYVDYDIELMTPQYGPSKHILNSSAKVKSEDSVTKSMIFGSAPIKTGGLDIVIYPESNQILFNAPGEYLIVIQFTGTGLAAPSVTQTNGGRTNLSGVINSNGTLELCSYLLSTYSVGATLSFNLTGSTTVTDSVLRIAPYPYTIG